MNDILGKGSYLASLIAAVLGLTINDIALVVGIVTSIGTFIVNWVYKRRNYKLEKQKLFGNEGNGKP